MHLATLCGVNRLACFFAFNYFPTIGTFRFFDCLPVYFRFVIIAVYQP
uniref:Uncharacterized protein n=1 Tax=Siphoviridae sp. ct1SN28 TaxID=2825308 RepID=A0A8S5TRM3_9CAUD|nr:MAG TPA: hypothetical protein [Siphoviridae sp. ct1SN28]